LSESEPPATVLADAKYLALAIRQLLTVSLVCQESPGRITATIEIDRLAQANSKTVPAVRLTFENPRLRFTTEELTIAFNLLRHIENTDPRLRTAGLKVEICRRIVIAHNGRIWGETATTGGGRFALVVPLNLN
jgi:light-regulated signal transduction histidine kinase (bacteriophytochrome)